MAFLQNKVCGLSNHDLNFLRNLAQVEQNLSYDRTYGTYADRAVSPNIAIE